MFSMSDSKIVITRKRHNVKLSQRAQRSPLLESGLNRRPVYNVKYQHKIYFMQYFDQRNVLNGTKRLDFSSWGFIDRRHDTHVMMSARVCNATILRLRLNYTSDSLWAPSRLLDRPPPIRQLSAHPPAPTRRHSPICPFVRHSVHPSGHPPAH